MQGVASRCGSVTFGEWQSTGLSFNTLRSLRYLRQTLNLALENYVVVLTKPPEKVPALINLSKKDRIQGARRRNPTSNLKFGLRKLCFRSYQIFHTEIENF